MLDNYREHIFDGVIFSDRGALRFADAPEVARTAERGVTLSIDAEEAAGRLGPPEKAAGSPPAGAEQRRAARSGASSAAGASARWGRRRLRFPPRGPCEWSRPSSRRSAFGVATYIAIADSGGGAPVCVGGSDGCQTVADSSYSHLLGVNIAIFGLLGYLLLLGAALGAATSPAWAASPSPWSASATASTSPTWSSS